jgi:hypothetical protein
MGDHRLHVGSKKRGWLVLAAAVDGHVLIGLDGTEGIEQLTDQHRKAGGRGHEEMRGADIAVLTARGAHAVLNGESDIRRLARRVDHVRIPGSAVQRFRAAPRPRKVGKCG